MIIDAPKSRDIEALRQLWKASFGDTDAFLDNFLPWAMIKIGVDAYGKTTRLWPLYTGLTSPLGKTRLLTFMLWPPPKPAKGKDCADV